MSEKCIVFSDIILETSTLVLISIGGDRGLQVMSAMCVYSMRHLDHRPRENVKFEFFDEFTYTWQYFFRGTNSENGYWRYVNEIIRRSRRHKIVMESALDS